MIGERAAKGQDCNVIR